jgi:hypothetical protein
MGNGLSLTGRFLAILVVGAAVLTGAAGPVGAAVIDTFDGVNSPSFVGAPPPEWIFINGGAGGWAAQTISANPAAHSVMGTVSDTGIPSVWGGNRGVSSNSPNASMSDPIGFSVNTTGGGFLSSLTAANSKTTLTLSYGLIDLTGVTAIEVDYEFSDANDTVNLNINGGPVDGTQPMGVGAGTMIFPISGFGANSTMDLIFNPVSTAHDFHITEIRADTPIPEPLSLAIWALTGVAGVGLVRVCRRREK